MLKETAHQAVSSDYQWIQDGTDSSPTAPRIPPLTPGPMPDVCIQPFT